MTETPAPDAAVQIVREALGHHYGLDARRVVAALARAGMLCEPGEVAWLRAVVESLHYRMTCVDPPPTSDEIISSLTSALDAAPAPEVAMPEEMAERARRHPGGEGLPTADDDPDELAARLYPRAP